MFWSAGGPVTEFARAVGLASYDNTQCAAFYTSRNNPVDIKNRMCAFKSGNGICSVSIMVYTHRASALTLVLPLGRDGYPQEVCLSLSYGFMSHGFIGKKHGRWPIFYGRIGFKTITQT